MDTIHTFLVELSNEVPVSLQILALCAAGLLACPIYLILASDRPLKGFPVVSLSERGLTAKSSWHIACSETVAKGLKEHKGPFQVMTRTGPKIVLPNRFADEIRTRKELNGHKAFDKEYFTNYPGREAHHTGFHSDAFQQELVRVKITQSLALITPDIVDETTASIRDIFGENSQWHTVSLKEAVCDLVARVSSRVFLGKPLCRDQRWLEIAKGYTVDMSLSAHSLGAVSPIMRPILYWFMASCTRLRAHVREANKLITPEVRLREERVRKALKAGQKSTRISDSIGWMVEIARGRKIDYVAAQLFLTMVAIHTTTEAITRALVDMCQHPDNLTPLREETIAVITEHGWTKAALQKLHLMDSFLKESSRHAPALEHSMNRYVEQDLELSDGTILPKGARLVVAGAYQDAAVYADPERFEAFRFVNTGQPHAWSHVATTPSHMGFGHGQYACPGRFLASNEIKIALCHLLLKYDMKLEDGVVPQTIKFEGVVSLSPGLEVSMKRRKEEIDLDLELEGE